ncbi:stealth family protein [Actinomadura barringtoniae]|uniref:Stealth family protein n=1 Tax=Actinomadura barringtoniae TaxID=1427535 RepID=A0A939PE67_9ACTN|nr:stealth family protein [Actinomadura barringtoniae]MBO2448473.1 stealth family protein [Actinomadura barringtoniae]
MAKSRPAGVRRFVPAPVRRSLKALLYPEVRNRVENARFRLRHRHFEAEQGVVKHHGRSRLAELRPELSALQVWEDTLQLVTGALEAASIHHFCLRPRSGLESAVAVSEVDRDRVIEVLAAAVTEAGAYVGPVKDPEGTKAEIGPKAWEAMAGRPTFRITRCFGSPDGDLVLGPELSCVVEFWKPVDGELVAPRPNRVVGELPLEGPIVRVTSDRLTALAGPESHGAVTFPVREETLLPLLDDIDFPIDVVYTWVDGDDPAWQDRRDAALGAVNDAERHELAINKSRFTSRDELRYSLRGLTMFAPWVRHVYIVTDDQVPAWLDVTHPGITVIDHKELFQDRGVLPTFNSHAIESQLHRIDGLSEHFLYFNDDVLLGRPVTPDMFFHPNGTTKYFPSSKQVDLRVRSGKDEPATAAGKNSRRLIEETFGGVITHRVKHTPHALRRSVLNEIEKRFPAEIAETAHHQFRHQDDVSLPSSLHHFYGFATGRAVQADLRYRYINLASPDASDRLRAVLAEREYDVFCVNDTESDAESQAVHKELTDRFLPAYFPVPSPYELG